MINKILISLFFCAVLTLAMPGKLMADTTATGTSGGDSGVVVPEFPDPLNGVSIPGIINSLIKTALSLVAGLFFVMFLWGGFQYMTAGGDAGDIKKARSTLSNAVIGIIIVLVSYGIIRFFITAFSKANSPQAEKIETTNI